MQDKEAKLFAEINPNFFKVFKSSYIYYRYNATHTDVVHVHMPLVIG